MGTAPGLGGAPNTKEMSPTPALTINGSISKVDDAKSRDKSRSNRKKAQTPSGSRMYVLRSSHGGVRVLRSMKNDGKKELPLPPAAPPPSSAGTVKGRRRKRRRKEVKKGVDDEFAKLRYKVGYYLRRMNYEQSLVDAYAGEGWKGQSLEKIRPEKELERAKSEITRCKLKIRDIFQQVDLLLSKGKFDDSLFDSEGQIDSEDIFCAKCSSKDLSVGNDIILCDGACDRGFHQKCLTPPLTSENIPAGDEGWLCPGCDCKVECIDLLNEHQGTELSIEDEWENIFPEAATIADKSNLYNDLGLPSDDSEDEDFAPDGSKVDDIDDDNEQDSESACSSEDSDYTSEEFDVPDKKMPNGDLVLPSDDSEDDDYNPNKRDADDRSGGDGSGSFQGSSSSDGSNFTSDSEDTGALNTNTEFTSNNSKSTIQPGQTAVKSTDIPSLHDEVLSLKNPDIDREILVTFPDRNKNRNGNKPDSDDGNASLDSEDKDETWIRSVSKKLRHKVAGKSSPSTKSRSSKQRNEVTGNAPCDNISNLNRDPPDASSEVLLEYITRRKQRKSQLNVVSVSGHVLDKKKPNDINMDTSDKYDLSGSCIHNGEIQGAFASPSSDGSKGPQSVNTGGHHSNRFFTKEASQKLVESFKDNQYPTTMTKQKLAEDIGITFKQVQKWFINARHSFRVAANSPRVAGENYPQAAASTSTNKKLVCENPANCQDIVASNDSLSLALDLKAGNVLPSVGGKRHRAVVDRKKLVLREIRKLKRGL